MTGACGVEAVKGRSKMKVVSSDGQLSIDNMDVAPVRVGGGSDIR